MQARTRKRPSAADGSAHITIECVTPELDCGRFAVKRVIGDRLIVRADIFKDGHDLVAARVRYRAPGEQNWRYTPLTYTYETDHWSGAVLLDRIGRWVFTVEAWTDLFGTWRSELEKKFNAGQDVSSELVEGAEFVESASKSARFGPPRTALRLAAERLRDESIDMPTRVSVGTDATLLALMKEHFQPRDITVYAHELPVYVDRDRARFGAWYEMFPRSQSGVPGKHGTFADAERVLPRIAELGFDVIYLPPIHPIGVTNRKGRNNTLVAGPDDPGSPWAIGGVEGGHTAVDPRLGTLDDFVRFVDRARALGLEIALDYALQCSPDHPWLKEHPEWFFIRPDGTIKYAENPPKKYQDIYPLNFWCEDRQGLWNACRDVFLFWIERGVRIFRVDNPHTKAFAFWEWVINEIQGEHPDVIFLAEAFTRPKRMKHLAKLGFTQSYTYFTWKNTSWELRDWITEMVSTPMAEYYRGNLFANTPDILHEYLVHGGRPAFRVRLLLAGTLAPTYGIYSGFELCENVPVRPGSEEYLNSEKYELRVRDFDAPGNINADVARLNRIRRAHRSLQLYRNLTVVPTENDEVFAYHKSDPDTGEDLLIVVNLDPHRVQETMVQVPLTALGLDLAQPYTMQDLLTGARYTWRGVRNYVRLDPALEPGHVLKLVRPTVVVDREDLE